VWLQTRDRSHQRRRCDSVILTLELLSKAGSEAHASRGRNWFVRPRLFFVRPTCVSLPNDSDCTCSYNSVYLYVFIQINGVVYLRAHCYL